MATVPHTRRTFGVEIECVFPNDARGIETAFDNEFNTGRDHWWNVHYDASLPNGGLEFSSPILYQRRSYGPSWQHLKDVMDWIKGRDGYVTAACGMHVHIGMNDLTKFEIARMARSWHANQDNIDMLVDKSRHNNGYCNKLGRYDMERIDFALRDPAYTPAMMAYDRGVFNMCALREHGTIEFRQHHGSVDFDEAQGWIKFLLGFVKNSIERKNPMPPYKEVKTLINRAKPSKTVEKILNMKIEGNLRGENLIRTRPQAPAADFMIEDEDYEPEFYDDDDRW